MQLVHDSINILDQIKKGKFLPVSLHPDDSLYFSGNDNQSSFNKNLLLQPDDWYYRHHPVIYNLNSENYRTEEFSKINWSESVVIFGCSYVFGDGLTEEDTLSARISSILGRPVINMGVSGSSVAFNFHNSIILKNCYPTPKAVINLWTHSDRTTYFTHNKITHFGGWNIKKNTYGQHWCKHEEHGETHALLSSIASKNMWKDICYYEASFFPNMAKLLECDWLSLANLTEFSRDLQHPGRKTINKIANQITKKLNIN